MSKPAARTTAADGPAAKPISKVLDRKADSGVMVEFWILDFDSASYTKRQNTTSSVFGTWLAVR